MFDDNKTDCRMESSREQSSPAAAQESPGEPLLLLFPFVSFNLVLLGFTPN